VRELSCSTHRLRSFRKTILWLGARASFSNGPERPLRISMDGRGIGLSITAVSTARFLLQQVTSSDWVRSTPSISN
jgi:hypothetical protein